MLGDSVVIVGDRTVAQVHVHLSDAGAAVEAGLACGRISQIRITALPPSTAAAVEERALVAVVAGPGLADAVTALGGTAVLPTGSHVSAEELTSALQQSCGEVIVLPNDMECLEIATHLRQRAPGPGTAGGRHPHRGPGAGSGCAGRARTGRGLRLGGGGDEQHRRTRPARSGHDRRELGDDDGRSLRGGRRARAGRRRLRGDRRRPHRGRLAGDRATAHLRRGRAAHPGAWPVRGRSPDRPGCARGSAPGRRRSTSS